MGNIRPSDTSLYINRGVGWEVPSLLANLIPLGLYPSYDIASTVRGPYPTLVGPPKITPVVPPDTDLAGRTVHLLCTYDIEDPEPLRVGYEVTWYKVIRFLGGKSGKLVLLSNRTAETAVVMGSGHADFHLGDTVSKTIIGVIIIAFLRANVK